MEPLIAPWVCECDCKALCALKLGKKVPSKYTPFTIYSSLLRIQNTIASSEKKKKLDLFFVFRKINWFASVKMTISYPNALLLAK